MQSQTCARIENSSAWTMRVRYGLNCSRARTERIYCGLYATHSTVSTVHVQELRADTLITECRTVIAQSRM